MVEYGNDYRFDNNLCLCGGPPYYYQDCKDAFRWKRSRNMDKREEYKQTQDDKEFEMDISQALQAFTASGGSFELGWGDGNDQDLNQEQKHEEVQDAVNNDDKSTKSKRKTKRRKQSKTKRTKTKKQKAKNKNQNECNKSTEFRLKVVDFGKFTGPEMIEYDMMDFDKIGLLFVCGYKGNVGDMKCGKKYKKKNDLKRHYMDHFVSEKAYKCNSCGVQRKNKHGMVDHIRICSGQHVIKCPVCNKRVHDYTARARCARSHNKNNKI